MADASTAVETTPAYWDDTYLFTLDAKAVAVRENDEEKEKEAAHQLLLDRTIFHPQGGGQPCDTGRIVCGDDSIFVVLSVKKNAAGEIVHYGCFKGPVFPEGASVTLYVDEERRRQSARLHSAGHLLDSVVSQLGLDLSPGKGYHFPDNPYVEYEGKVPAEEREELREKIEEVVNVLIAEATAVDVKVAKYAELDGLLGGPPPSYISDSQPCRVVSMAGTACPCGGTHVPNVGDIGRMKITKLGGKRNKVRISYALE